MARDVPGVPDRTNAPVAPDRPERFQGSDQPQRAEVPFAPEVEPYQRRMDRSDSPGGDTPREAVRDFEPERAGLEPITAEEATQYVRDHIADRPWLNHAQYVDPDTRRVLVALDKGNGHALERHGSTVTPEQTEARAKHLEDPALAVDAARTPGRDAFGSRRHTCGDSATRIRDPHAFAVCVARGVEHPHVRERLDRPCGRGVRTPPAIEVPLADLLGADGYKYCDGHRLEPVDGSRRIANEERTAWVDAIRDGQEPGVPEPRATRLETEDFQNASALFAFRANSARTAWEVATMYVKP